MVVAIRMVQDRSRIENFLEWVKAQGLGVHVSEGDNTTIVGLVGDTSCIDIDLVRSFDIVESVIRIQEPYKKANRRFHPMDSIIDVCGHKFGGKHFQIIAGPCSVESEEQIVEIARAVKAAGATVLRGGAYKPRTSPYSFQGLREEGIDLLRLARLETGLPICTEIMSERQIDDFYDVDILQVGARNMQNFELLKQLGGLEKPVLLKRGLSSTIEEWLMSAEYIMAGGNENVILCERGIRTFEPYTRNTLDLSAIPVLKERTHLPVIVDPSHASGLYKLVKPMSLAAVGAGADGLMIEVHNDPMHALSDGPQSLKPKRFDDIVRCIDAMLPIVNKERDSW